MHPSNDHFGIKEAKSRWVGTVIEPDAWKMLPSTDADVVSMLRASHRTHRTSIRLTLAS